jgi:hypothetical protein
MYIYSNKLLTWPQVLHVAHAATTYPGKWHNNYYFFQIKMRHPTHILTYSPFNLLDKDQSYYCYDRFYRNKGPEKIGNISESVNIFDLKNKSSEEKVITIPRDISPNDIILIYQNENSSPPLQ